MAALEAAKQECQADLAEMQEQLETVQTAADAAEQRAQQADKAYQKQPHLRPPRAIGRRRPCR